MCLVQGYSAKGRGGGKSVRAFLIILWQDSISRNFTYGAGLHVSVWGMNYVNGLAAAPDNVVFTEFSLSEQLPQ